MRISLLLIVAIVVGISISSANAISQEIGAGYIKTCYDNGKCVSRIATTYPLYNGSYSLVQIQNIDVYNGGYNISWNGGRLQLVWDGVYAYDMIVNPDSNTILSYWDFWKVESQRQTGQKGWQEEIPTSNQFIRIDNNTVKRVMGLDSGGKLNITYQNTGTGIKYILNLTAGYNRPYRLAKRTTIPAGQGKLNNDSKQFNPGFFNNITFWNYQDIPSPAQFNLSTGLWEGGYNVSQWIPPSRNEYFLQVEMFGGKIVSAGAMDGFDPSWSTNGSVGWTNTTLYNLQNLDNVLTLSANTSTGVWVTSYDGTQEYIFALASYNGNLYAGQGGDTGDGDVLVFNGTSWSTSYNGTQEFIFALASYNGNLYAGQGADFGDGDVLVFNGTSWSTSYNGAQEYIPSLASYNGNLYAGQGADTGDGDVLVFNGTSWSTSYNGAQEFIYALASYNGNLYAGQGGDTGDGDVLVFNGTSWSTSYNGTKKQIRVLASYNGNLYAGQGPDTGDGDVLVFNGTSWSTSYDGAQEYIPSLASYNGNLYAGQGTGPGDGDVLVYNQSLYGSGYVQTYYDSGTGNETYQIDTNINTPVQSEANYSVFYRTNGTGSWTAIGTSNATMNQSISLSTKYRNTDVKIELYGNNTSTPELVEVTFWTQAASTSSIVIPANSWGMFNNWSYNNTFSKIAANESNDVAYSYYNSSSGEWESFYVGYTYNQNNSIDFNHSVMGYFNVSTTVTASTMTPTSTSLLAGWNQLYVEGTSNRTISAIKTNLALSCDPWEVYKFNTTAADYSNTSTESLQPNEGFLTYVNTSCTWTRATI